MLKADELQEEYARAIANQGYGLMIQAIFADAKHDYVLAGAALHREKKPEKIETLTSLQREVRRFFYSDWATELAQCDFNRRIIMAHLEKLAFALWMKRFDEEERIGWTIEECKGCGRLWYDFESSGVCPVCGNETKPYKKVIDLKTLGRSFT